MEEVRRVPTTKEKKKSTVLLIILAVLLGIVLIATAVYFYTTTGEQQEDPGETTTETTCACYYIDPAVVTECGDPRRGFMFELATVSGDQACNAACSTDNLTPNLLNSNTEQELYQVCPIQIVQDSRCNEMIIKDSSGKIVTGKVSSDEDLTIEAKFDAEYAQHKFIINNQESDPDVISPDKLTIQKNYSDLNTSTLNIFATAVDSTGDQINSPICRRLIEVEQEGTSEVSTMQIQTRQGADTYKISKIRIGAGNVAEDADLTVRFSFDNDLADLSMTKGITIDSAKGEITMIEQDLYNSENFSTDLSFSQLDGLSGTFIVTAEVRTESELIGTTEESFTLPEIQEGEEVEETGEEAEESNFNVEKTSNVSCVERVAPNNIAQFTLTASNQANTTQNVTSVKDKLPLGFTYVQSSSKINGVSVTDADYVTVEKVGDTQEIVWEKAGGWSINSNQDLTIVFQSQADENALTGKNQNEVVITPVEIPADPTTLRAEYVIEVAQDCPEYETPPTEEEPEEETPEEEEPGEETPVEEEEEEGTTPDTGIFDSVIGRIIMGILVIVTGWYIYSKPMGQAVVEKLVESGLYKEAEMASWKVFKPKKYFETKIVRKLGKKKKKD